MKNILVRMGRIKPDYVYEVNDSSDDFEKSLPDHMRNRPEGHRVLKALLAKSSYYEITKLGLITAYGTFNKPVCTYAINLISDVAFRVMVWAWLKPSDIS
ncbi:hypothetical protein ACYUFO_003501 [Vibrio parahaemolyticus]